MKEAVDRLREKARNESTVLALNEITRLQRSEIEALRKERDEAESDKLENYRRLTEYRRRHVRYRAVMEMAVEALEDIGDEWGFTSQRTLPKRTKAITALRECLKEE